MDKGKGLRFVLIKNEKYKYSYSLDTNNIALVEYL